MNTISLIPTCKLSIKSTSLPNQNSPTMNIVNEDKDFFSNLSIRLNQIKSRKIPLRSSANLVRASSNFCLTSPLKSYIKKNNLSYNSNNIKEILREEILRLEKDKKKSSGISSSTILIKEDEEYQPVCMLPIENSLPNTSYLNNLNLISPTQVPCPHSTSPSNTSPLSIIDSTFTTHFDPIMSYIFETNANPFLGEEVSSFNLNLINCEILDMDNTLNNTFNSLPVSNVLSITSSQLNFSYLLSQTSNVINTIKFCKNHSIIIPNFLINPTIKFNNNLLEYNNKPYCIPMPSPIDYNTLGDKLENLKSNEWIFPRVLSCLPSYILQYLLKLPSIYEHKRDNSEPEIRSRRLSEAESFIPCDVAKTNSPQSHPSSYIDRNFRSPYSMRKTLLIASPILTTFSTTYPKSNFTSRESLDESNSSLDTSKSTHEDKSEPSIPINSFFLKRTPKSWVSLGCLWVTKPTEGTDKYHWVLRLFLLLDNLFLECNPEGTSILGYCQLSTAIIKSLGSKFESNMSNIYHQFPLHFPNISSIISITCFPTSTEHLKDNPSSTTFYIASTHLDQISGIYSVLKLASNLSISNLYQIEGIPSNICESPIKPDPEEDLRKGGLLGRGRFSEVRVGTHLDFQFPTISMPISLSHSHSHDLDQFSARDRSRSRSRSDASYLHTPESSTFLDTYSESSNDIILEEIDSLYDQFLSYDQEDLNEKDITSCALKIISKENFSALVDQSRERGDALVREILSMIIITASSFIQNFPNNSFSSNIESSNLDSEGSINLEYIKDHIPFAMLHSIFESPWGLIIAEDRMVNNEQLQSMEEKGEVMLDLFDHLALNGPMDEEDCKDIVIQLLLVLIQLQKLGIAHRDVKLSNILVKPKNECSNIWNIGNYEDDSDSDGLECLNDQEKNLEEVDDMQFEMIPSYNPDNKFHIKLTDWGMCGFTSSDGLLRGRCGTPGCVAPEVLKAKVGGAYTLLVDTFSLGVVAFLLVLGFEPFPGNSLEQYIALCEQKEKEQTNKAISNLSRISSNSLTFPSHWVNGWDTISPACRSFLLFLLHPTFRPSALETLNHPWIRSHYLESKYNELE